MKLIEPDKIKHEKKKGKGGTKHEDDKEIEQTFLKTIPNFRCSKEDGRQ